MKKLLIAIAVVVVVLLGGVVALVTLVNPNQFKPLIVEQAKKHTGLDLVIEGDISWQFFPSIGFELGKTELRNPAGFDKQNLFKVDSVGIDVSVMPLFSQQLDIGKLRLDGAEFALITRKDGSTNLDALTQSSSSSQPATQTQSTAGDVASSTSSEPSSTETETGAAWSINLAGVSVSNAAVEIQDLRTGSFTKLFDVAFNLSEFAFEQWSSVTFAAKGQNNQQVFETKGDLELKLAPGLSDYALRNINLDSRFSDPSTKMESIKLALETFQFDAVNPLTFEIKGQAADMDIDMTGAAKLSVDKAMTLLQVNQFTLDGQLQGESLPQSPMAIGLLSDIRFDLAKSHLSLVLSKLTANALQFDGKADVTLAEIAKVRFALHSPNIDLDEFLGLGEASSNQGESSDSSQSTSSSSPQSGSSQAGTPAAKQPSAEVEPDLSALANLDVKGDITIDKFKANNAKMEKVSTSFSIDRGVVDLSAFTANLYQGSVTATGRLDARKSPATYSAKKQIRGVKVQPLLVDVANTDQLEGTGNIDVDVKGSSLTPSGIQQNLVGTIGISFTDGAVNGINVAQLIRENYAKIKGQKVEAATGVQKTDFSAMKATLVLNKGNVSTNDLTMQSPLLRIRGQGGANYIKQTVNFTVSTSVVGSLEGQGGKDIDELKDVTIPINISGSWDAPKFKLVFDDVLKQKAQKEIDRGLEKLDGKIKDEKTKEAVNSLIKGLFN